MTSVSTRMAADGPEGAAVSRPRNPGRWSFMVEAGRMIGRRIIVLMVICVVAGLLLGVIEILFGLALYGILAYYELLPNNLPHGFQSFMAIASPVPTLIILAVVIFVVRGAVSALPGIVTEALHNRIKRAVADATLSADGDGSRLSVAETSHLLADLLPKSAGFISSLTQGMTSFIIATSIMIGVIRLSVPMSLITFAVSAAMLMPVLIAKHFDRHLAQTFFIASETFTTRVMKAIRNAVLLKISGTADIERNILVAASHDAERTYRKFIITQAVQGGLPLLGGVFVILALLEVRARMDIFTIAEMVPFVYLLSRLAGACSNLITTISGIRYNKAFFDRFVGFREKIFLEIRPPQGGLPVAQLRKLDVENLSIGRERVLVENLSAHLQPGEMLLISGHSGRGKTTLLMTLVGLVPAHGGKALWNDIGIENYDHRALRERIGYAGPDPYLLDASIEHNLLFGKTSAALSESDYRKALLCARAEFVFELSAGIHHLLHEGGDGISAGQKQRIAIARALLRKPDVLILDEATGNVDQETEAAIIENIRRDYPNLMIIAVSHRRSLEAFATVILHL